MAICNTCCGSGSPTPQPPAPVALNEQGELFLTLAASIHGQGQWLSSDGIELLRSGLKHRFGRLFNGNEEAAIDQLVGLACDPV